MTWKEKLCSNLLLRNMASDVIGYPASAAKKTFIPYFKYKIGVYQKDYYLYFTAPPTSVRYTNDIFNKLYEYNGYDIIQYVEFHYAAYDNKTDFLHFLRYEIQLFYLIQNATAPKEHGKVEQVFKQFSAIDIASILHFHFEEFKNKKINTIQGNIKGATDKLNFKNHQVQKLNEALENFFYSSTR